MENKKYTVITGASSGIGYEVAKAFAKRGTNVIIVARRKEQLYKLKQEILTSSNVDIVIKTVDLSKVKEAYQLYIDLKQYQIETWINNAGFGFDGLLLHQNPEQLLQMIHLNVETVALLSTLYTQDYKNEEGAQLINVASVVGYFLIPKTVGYAATKFFVSAFTEGLDKELKAENYKLRAKVLAPAATKTEFSALARDAQNFDYAQNFNNYHTANEMAKFLIQLYDSDKTVGIVNLETYDFELKEGIHTSF